MLTVHLSDILQVIESDFARLESAGPDDWSTGLLSSEKGRKTIDFFTCFCNFLNNFGVAVIKSAASAASPEGILQP